MIRPQLILVLMMAMVMAAGPTFGQKKKDKKKKKEKETVEEVAQPVMPKDTMLNHFDSLSYAVGVFAANHFRGRGINTLNYDLLGQGFGDHFEDGQAKMSAQMAQKIVDDYIEYEKNRILAENKQKGDKFLRENRLRPGIKNMVSGLQYRVITEGDGPKPGLRNVVTCHYKGTKIDGTVFESSYDTGNPIQFPVNGVIQGWTEALRMMPVGSKWELFIPSEMAYGEARLATRNRAE